MAATTYWHDGSTFVDISGRMLKDGWELREDAEEGSAPTSQVPLADQGMDFAPVAFHPYHVLESTSTSDDDVLIAGFLWEPDLSRGEGDGLEPMARNWSQGLTDENHLWDRIAMKGSDNNRPAETDVDRITWLFTTSEAAIFDDVTTFVHTGSPVNMDAVDYTGQKLSDVMRDCSEASGKNWWTKLIRMSGVLTLVVWYGRDSSSRYDSDLGLSDDPDDLDEIAFIDGSAVRWPLGAATKVSRDYGRVYCGLLGQFEGGRTYRHNSTTHATYFAGPGPDMHRDTIAPMPNVKSLTKAQARGDRMLADMATPDVRVTTKVRLPAALATKIRSGMRIPVKVTYDPELNEWTWCRILNCTVTPVSAGTEYDLDLEMTPTGDAGNAEPGPQTPFTGDAFAGLQRTTAYSGLGYLPAFAGSYNTGENIGGWPEQNESGPLHVVESAAPYLSISTSQAIVVRIHARGEGANVFFPAQTRTLSVTINGVVVGTDSRSTATGFDAWSREVNLRNVHLSAGDVVSVTGTATDEWGNLAVDHTFLLVGRGTYSGVTTPGDPTPPGWIGP